MPFAHCFLVAGEELSARPDRSEQKETVWLRLWSSRSPEILSMELAHKHRPGKPVSACLWNSGAFNICYRVRYDEGPDAIVRFAALGRAILRREKVRNEVATMRYIHRTTSIAVPEVFGSGICWAGPYMVMSFLEGRPLSQLLKDPSAEGRPVLNPGISDRSLRRAYREMAGLILELSRHEFDAIGALEEDEGGFSITKRPLTFNMNELMASANLPEATFPSHTFSSATAYFQALAGQHLSHLRLQQRDAVSSEENCRKKFIARPFRLYCDDFRPSNILVESDPSCAIRVSGVIDWLLLQSPEDWANDLNEFLARYSPRLCTFLEVLRDCENKLIEQHLLSESQRLSPRMAQSMEYSSMFDEIYWTFIDQRYHGTFTSLDDRVRLLDQEQQHEMNELVRLKTRQYTMSKDEFEDHYPIDKLLEL
ncbi:hypothetical protein ASPCADRAFT_517496 [Aspergillus carbonarius ITEM 5010]|uniref:Aminoglycoside phosphotransferase domain-containing protein n=1 Tax=Aspergillus carbonarius (strain ITEM 5010) TaxID=602072 RepID=A0A1R3RDU9_ASPC5|nr:hypothetical protein ASPCADRAFT_517496 [Aspergillus carbonarius ITEM 5010]